MKTLLKTLVVALISCLSYGLTAQSGTQQTYYASLLPEESNTLFLDLKGSVEMEVWEKDYIMFYVTVDASTSNENVLDYLKDIGRYNLQSNLSLNNYLSVSMPGIKKEAKVNGVLIKESMSFKVMVPSYLSVDIEGQNDMVTYFDTEENYYVDGNLYSMIQMNK